MAHRICDVLVIGSGAAGLRAAAHPKTPASGRGIALKPLRQADRHHWFFEKL